MNTLHRPVRLIAPGIYTTPEGEYRIENIRIASGDRNQENKWGLYLQNEPGTTPDTLDQRATFISDHDTLDGALRALGEIRGEEHVAACFKECPIRQVPARELRAGQLVDLEDDPIGETLGEQRRHEWEFIEVTEVVPYDGDRIRVEFDGKPISVPGDYLLMVVNDERSGTPGPQPA